MLSGWLASLKTNSVASSALECQNEDNIKAIYQILICLHAIKQTSHILKHVDFWFWGLFQRSGQKVCLCRIHCHSLPGLMPILDPAGRGYCQIWTNHKVGLKTLANDKARGLMRRTWPGLRHWSTTNCPGHANLTSNRIVASLNRRRPCNSWVKENSSFPLAVLVYSLATHFTSCIADQGPAFLIILDISYVAIFFFDI